MAVLPLFADQPLNAAAVARAGAGISLEGGRRRSPGSVRPRMPCCASPAYRETARRIADEIAALPLAGEALDRRLLTSV